MLTIDKDLQRVAQDKLKESCDEVSLTKGAGAVVVQHTKTGAKFLHPLLIRPLICRIIMTITKSLQK